MMSMGSDSVRFNDPAPQVKCCSDLLYDGTFNTENHQTHTSVQELRLRDFSDFV